MADASSVRKASSLPVASGSMASSIRYHNNQLWFSDGTEWQSLAVAEGEYPVITTYNAAAPVTAAIYTATRAVRVLSASLCYGTAEATATTLTANITKDTFGVAAGAGTALFATAWNCKGAINTTVTQTLSITPTTGIYTDVNASILSVGEVLSLKFSTAPTELANLSVVITLAKVDDPKQIVAISVPVTGATIFQSPSSYTLVAASAIFGTAAGGASTMTLTKEGASTTTAPGLGTSLHQSGSFNLNGSTATAQWATLSATAATVTLAAGDRISVKQASGTFLATATLVVTLYLLPVSPL